MAPREWDMATKQERTRMARFFAPGASMAKKFSVQLDMKSNGDSFKINWDSFKDSTQVKEQMQAAGSSQKLKHG